MASHLTAERLSCQRRLCLAGLVYMLISRVGLDESEVAEMSKDEAVARLQRYWTEGS